METVTTKYAAEVLQTSDDTVLRLIRSGALNAEQLMRRGRYRIIKKSLEDYAAQNNITLKQVSQPE